MGLPYDLNNDLRSEICMKLQDMGVAVKYHHHEVGSAGQLEIEVELEDMLKMADSTMLAKYVIKMKLSQMEKLLHLCPSLCTGKQEAVCTSICF